MLPAKSFAPVVTRTLYVVFKEKLLLGLVLNIVLPAEVVVEDICTQVLKLSEDTCKVPEQLVSEVLVVIEVLSIASEKVTEMDESMDTVVSESDGEVEETVGAILSSLKA